MKDKENATNVEVMEDPNDVEIDKREQYVKTAGHDKAEVLVPDNMTLEDIGATEEEIKKVTRKIDFTIIPFLAVCYVFYYVDKTTLSYAAIFGIKEDLGLHGSQYNWLSSVFYIGFFVWQFPTNFLLLKFPVARYLGINIFFWGAFLMIQAACPSFATLVVVRILGGAAEAVSDPAFMLITSIWYTRRQQPVRFGTWYAANGLGIAVGGLLGYGIGHIKGSLPSWKYEFLIIGALCATWGITVALFLPSNPVDSKFLTNREKQILLIRLRENQTGIESKVFKWQQVKEAMLDVKCIAFAVIAMIGNVPNGGISNFGTLIIQGFGFSTLGTTLLQVPYGVVIIISLLSSVWVNDKVGANKRCLVAILYILPNVCGAFGLYFLPQENKGGRLTCYYLTGPYNAAFVIVLSLATANIAGHTKKVTCNAMVFLGFCIGNFVSPFFYLTSQAPQYQLGIGSMLFSHFVEIALLALLALYLRRENKKREANSDASDLSNAFLDMTDKENLNFRYIY